MFIKNVGSNIDKRWLIYLLGNIGSIRRAAEVLIKVGSNIDIVGHYSHF